MVQNFQFISPLCNLRKQENFSISMSWLRAFLVFRCVFFCVLGGISFQSPLDIEMKKYEVSQFLFK